MDSVGFTWTDFEFQIDGVLASIRRNGRFRRSRSSATRRIGSGRLSPIPGCCCWRGCQTASNRDPLSARKRTPIPAVERRRAYPAHVHHARNGGGYGPEGLSGWEAAREWLGLTRKEADQLFQPPGWSTSAGYTLDRAIVTVERLAETGQVIG